MTTELEDDLEAKNRWLLALSRRANHHGFISPDAAHEAAVEAGIAKPKPAVPSTIADKLGELADDEGRVTIEQATAIATGETPEPPPPGDGGAIEHGTPPAPGALDARIAEADRAGDSDLAIHLKNQKLTELHERMEGR